MDVFELEYKYIEGKEEKTVQVRTVERNGVYYIQLPERPSNVRGVFQEAIVVNGKTWKFISRNPEEPEYFACVYLNEDGTVQYENDMTHGVKTSQDKFDPLLANSDFPHNIAACMHYLREQFEYILDIQNKVKDVRRKRLNMRLKKLGYSSPEDALTVLRDHSIYCDLNDICEELENYEDYIEIDGFSRREEVLVQGRRETNIVYSAPTPEGKDAIVALFERISQELKRESEIQEAKQEMLDRKMYFITGTGKRRLSEFEMTFPGIMSMTERDWELYSAYITGECREFWPKDTEDRKLQPFERMPEASMRFPATKPVQTVQLNNNVWNRYAKAIMQIARLYLSLNADILPTKITKQIEDCTGVYGKETEDFSAGEELRCLIGKFIDSSTFTIACNIEDIATCAMNLDFLDAVDNLIKENGDILTGGFRESVLELRNDTIAQIQERMKHVAMFNNAQIKLQQLKGIKRIETAAPEQEEK